MHKTPRIEFLLESRVNGIYIHTPKNVEFTLDDSNVRISLHPKRLLDNTASIDDLICKVEASYEVSQEIWLFVKALVSHNTMIRVADDLSLPYIREHTQEILINKKGEVSKGFSPRRNHCPIDIATLLEEVELQLYESAKRFLHLLRWRQKTDSNAELIESSSLFWKFEESDHYHLTPLQEGIPITLHMKKGLEWEESHALDLHQLWSKKELTEPLGHIILNEAKSLISTSPASAILMIACALESAVKIHISNQVPDAFWLLEETSAPPIPKILKSYIPLLHEKQGKDMTFWKKLQPTREKIQWLIEDRNKIAHTGKPPERINLELIHEYSLLVSDYLYILDFLDGHEWAKSLVSNKTKKLLNWPETGNRETSITLTVL